LFILTALKFDKNCEKLVFVKVRQGAFVEKRTLDQFIHISQNIFASKVFQYCTLFIFLCSFLFNKQKSK